jgi:hypothetical protein
MATTRDAQTAAVKEGAFAFFCPEFFVRNRVVDHAGCDLAIFFQSDGNGKMRDTVQEVGCAVQRVDDPAACFILAFKFAAFFKQEADFRAGFGEFLDQNLFCTGVGGADKISREAASIAFSITLRLAERTAMTSPYIKFKEQN